MTTTKAFCRRKSGKSRTIFTVFSVFSLFSPESETTSPALIVSFLLCFFACLIVSISFRLFGCFFFLIQKITENITHRFFFVISHLWYFLRDFDHIFF